MRSFSCCVTGAAPKTIRCLKQMYTSGKPYAVILFTFFCGCSLFPQFNESGKESKLKCLYFSTGSLKIVYDCRSREKLVSLTIIDDSKSSPKPVYFRKQFDPAVGEYIFPFIRDSLDNKVFRIIISTTGSPSREGYTIYVKPEDFTKKSKVYCRYSPL